MMRKVQEEFDSRPGDYQMLPGEYEGPLTVSRSCVVDGCMSTLWAEEGPVLIVEAGGVTIKNLRVEVTGKPKDAGSHVSIRTGYPDTKLSEVEVNGNLEGFPNEVPLWEIPSVISLGTFAAGKENTFAFEVTAPANAKLSCGIKDVEIFPKQLVPGKNKIIIRTASMRDNTILYGEIMVVTGVSRRIYVTGKAQTGAAEHQEMLLLTEESIISGPMPISLPDEVIAPAVSDNEVQSVRRGQRLPVGEFSDKMIKVVYEHQGIHSLMEIDGYVFLLQDNGRVHGDQDLIFFGNPESENGEIKMNTDNSQPMVLVDLKKARPNVNKIAICFSIYGEDPSQNFSLVDKPIIRIFNHEKEVYRFRLSELQKEKTVVALEMYRYKGEWKFNFVGAGYHSGLKELCESYGVEVE